MDFIVFTRLSSVESAELRHLAASCDEEEVGGALAVRVRARNVERVQLKTDLIE